MIIVPRATTRGSTARDEEGIWSEDQRERDAKEHEDGKPKWEEQNVQT